MSYGMISITNYSPIYSAVVFQFFVVFLKVDISDFVSLTRHTESVTPNTGIWIERELCTCTLESAFIVISGWKLFHSFAVSVFWKCVASRCEFRFSWSSDPCQWRRTFVEPSGVSQFVTHICIVSSMFLCFILADFAEMSIKTFI